MSRKIEGGLYIKDIENKEEARTRQRKTITIQMEEWENWLELKENRTWTQTMRQVRETAEEAEEYKDLIKQIALNAGTMPKSKAIIPTKRPAGKLSLSSLGVQTPAKSREFMKTLKEMEEKGVDFKSLLSPVGEGDDSPEPKSDEELEKLKEEAFNRGEERWKKKNLHPPPS